jgi:hypothetical protein
MPLNLEFEFLYPFGPVIDLRLRDPDSGTSTLSSALVDTGADISLFDESVAESIGIRGLGTGNLIGLDVLAHFDFGLSHRDRLGYLGRPA